MRLARYPYQRSVAGGATASLTYSAEALLPSIMAYAAKFGLSTLNGIVVIALCLEMRMRMIMNSFGKSEDIILTSLLANSYRPSHCISLCCVCRLRSFTVMHRWSIGLIVNRALQSLWLWLWLDIRTWHHKTVGLRWSATKVPGIPIWARPSPIIRYWCLMSHATWGLWLILNRKDNGRITRRHHLYHHTVPYNIIVCWCMISSYWIK